MRIGLIISAAVASCVAGTAQAQETRPPQHSVRAMGRIEIPPEIAPAVIPYMMCLQTAMSEVSKESDGLDEAEFAAAGPVVREKCAAVRGKALDDGIRMLANRRIGTAQDRFKRVEATLVNIEDTFLNMKFPAPSEGSN